MSCRPRAGGGWATRGAGLVAAVAIAAAGCSEPRMTVDDWERVWQQTVDRVAEVEAAEISEEACTEVLSYLRTQEPRLNLLPAEGLETPVDSWFALAESAFFDCPPRGETVSGWADAFERLSVLEAEVATVLARHR